MRGRETFHEAEGELGMTFQEPGGESVFKKSVHQMRQLLLTAQEIEIRELSTGLASGLNCTSKIHMLKSNALYLRM